MKQCPNYHRWKFEVKILNSFVNMTRNITLKIQLKFCGTSGSQALMHLRLSSHSSKSAQWRTWQNSSANKAWNLSSFIPKISKQPAYIFKAHNNCFFLLCMPTAVIRTMYVSGFRSHVYCMVADKLIFLILWSNIYFSLSKFILQSQKWHTSMTQRTYHGTLRYWLK